MPNRHDQDGLKTAAYWTKRATEARALAEGMRDPTARALMQDIAHNYDLMAKQVIPRPKQGVRGRKSAGLATGTPGR